jgi:hypothetical protein
MRVTYAILDSQIMDVISPDKVSILEHERFRLRPRLRATSAIGLSNYVLGSTTDSDIA